MASEVTNNSTGIITPDEGKNILNQLGETAKRTALGGADVLYNFSGGIKEGLLKSIFYLYVIESCYNEN